MLTAASVGACHKRERWFMLAHTMRNRYGIKNQQGRSSGQDWERQANIRGNGEIQAVADSMREGLERQREKPSGVEQKFPNPCKYAGWKSQPTIRRGVDGVQDRVHRIKSLGNSVIPLQVKIAFEKLMGVNHD